MAPRGARAPLAVPLLLAALMVALMSCASAARVVSEEPALNVVREERERAMATARRDELFKRFKPASSRRADADEEHERKPLTPEERAATLAEIKSMLLEQEAFDRWHLRKEGVLPPSEEEDSRVKQLLGVDPEAFCHSRKYRKKTMKTLKDAPFIGLFNDLRNVTRFEGSSITYAKGAYWVVFDSLRTIGRVGLQFQFRGAENALIPEDADEVESQFEGLQYMPSTDSFLAVRESVDHDTHGLVPLTEEIKLNKDGTSWTVKDVCPVKFFGLEDANKGWEGLHYFEKDGERYLLGLCESNYCKTIQGEDPPGLERGNGRLILSKYVRSEHANDTDRCHWETLKEIKLPPEAYFLDYAGVAFWPHPFGSEVTVVSQEDAAVFLGAFNWERMEFEPGGKVFFFPRDDDCKKVFCNVEGLTFLDRRRMLFASDRSKPTQSYECMGRDQSVHIMALP